jgi:DNA polymerase/3'-5' exonuclease PolX
MTVTERPRLLLSQAEAIAARFVALLAGTYERLDLAGSIRRQAPTVGDIEIVATPAVVERVERDLFGDVALTVHVDQLDARLTTLAEIEPRRNERGGTLAWGPLAKFLTFEGANIDLFTPSAERYGWILALRTGPAAYAAQLVTPLGVRNRYGRPGLLPARFASRDGWLTHRVSGERIATPNERDVFRIIGLEYLEPWERT